MRIRFGFAGSWMPGRGVQHADRYCACHSGADWVFLARDRAGSTANDMRNKSMGVFQAGCERMAVGAF